MAVANDVNSIHESLMKIRRVVQRQDSAFLSSGAVINDGNDPGGHFIVRNFSGIFSTLSYVFFSMRKALNIPVYRWKRMDPYDHPSTVSQAVQNTNDNLEGLMELAVYEKYSSGVTSTIMGEANNIQMLLYNIKVHSTEPTTPTLSLQKEE